MFSRLRDRTYTTPFREKKAKTQGQLNGNVKLAGNEYGRLNVSRHSAYIISKKQTSPNYINVEVGINFANGKMAGKYCAPASTFFGFDWGRGK